MTYKLALRARAREKARFHAERSSGQRAGIHPGFDLRVGCALDQRLELFDGGAIGGEAGHAQHRGVAEKDLREGFADNGTDAEPRQPLRRVLTRRTAPEIAVHDEDARSRIPRVVEGVCRVGLAIVLEHVPFEPLKGDRLQEARRHDSIGIQIVAAQGKTPARD